LTTGQADCFSIKAWSPNIVAIYEKKPLIYTIGS
jgi:hypothetical protein